MTAEELEKSVAIELFKTDDLEGYQQYDAGILVSFPDVYKELARMAIRVCMEAAAGEIKEQCRHDFIEEIVRNLIPESAK